MKAYAILSGGGVKGPALAGCVNAAIDAGVEFVGYGGTSAGSVVALLASIGYVGEELRHIAIDDTPFDKLLDDEGVLLKKAKGLVDRFLEKGYFWTFLQKWAIVLELSDLAAQLGLYTGKRIEGFLREKIYAKCVGGSVDLRKKAKLNFADLKSIRGTLLKIVATDLRNREAAVLEDGSPYGSDVIEAVRASTAYPFIFRPVEIGDIRLVDGGLASNLPVFLFRTEQKRDNFPVLAFDIGASAASSLEKYGLNEFTRDLLSSALEASDSRLRSSLPNIKYIKIPPGDEDALDFTEVTRNAREALYNRGYTITRHELDGYFPLTVDKLAFRDLKKKLQSMYVRPEKVEPILAIAARDCEELSRAEDVRATVMLPTTRADRTRMVVYDFNMEGDSDRGMILNEFAGCSGAALESEKGVTVADLDQSRRDPAAWGLIAEEADRVPEERKAMMSVVIPSWTDSADVPTRDARDGEDQESLKRYRVGVLSVDTTSPLSHVKWDDNDNENTKKLAKRLSYWAQIIGKLLSN